MRHYVPLVRRPRAARVTCLGLEDSPSGLWRTLGKRVGCKPSGVRIPHPPPLDPSEPEVGDCVVSLPHLAHATRGGAPSPEGTPVPRVRAVDRVAPVSYTHLRAHET